MVDKLTVTLSGPRRCGKTHVALLIEDSLKEYGYDVEWKFPFLDARESARKRRELLTLTKEKLKEEGPGDGCSPYGHEYKRIVLEESYEDWTGKEEVERSENAKALEDKFTKARIVSIQGISSQLSITGIRMARRELVEGFGEKCSMLFLCVRDYDNLLSNIEFSSWFDAYTNSSALEKGKVGMMAGMEVYTDANFPPDQRFLKSSWVGSKTW